MALTKEVIQKNEALKDLSDDQIGALETLSQNDENTVIGTKIGELHGQYDTDILEASGVEKVQGEKSYVYAKRVIADLKTNANGSATLKTEIETLKADKKDLETKLEAGSNDEALKTELNDTKTRLEQAQSSLDTQKTDYEKKLGDKDSEFADIRLDSEFDKALSGIKFKDEKLIPVAVRETYIDAAKSKIKNGSKPEFVNDGNNGQTLVFRNDKGEVLNNPENKLNPFTAKEMLSNELKEIIDIGKKVKGSGTNDKGDPDRSDVLDLTGIKTQVEADDMIVKHLMSTGHTRGSEAFASKQKEIREKNGVSKLQIR